ncbi:hypothetical protein VE01_05323 [Pseudogymnoascus verrucosus]|uniref:Uncharacterized protein n=1 Tax=Pseudogymnoascus verrucosus TaxID=342668 RepID=A0A1B8GL56_9PEZI|nr:uncharacterized protein VE01_05323 [Pseudogymnoascus verrucosus]OBT96567.1 hypothetical protein VE01_05323 [Pseudogymnoascus verrucosus]
MSIPMQVSIPLVLPLKCQVLYDIVSNTRWNPGEKYTKNRTPTDFNFIDSQSERFGATLQFGRILRLLYEHPDWSQIHAFCSKRYSKREMFSNRSARVLKPSKEIGLPEDFIEQLKQATLKSVGHMMGPDPFNCSIGPAVSVGIGAASYMDLIYGGNRPGTHVARPPGRGIAASKQGGRGRNSEEWKALWVVIADWVYEMEAASILKFAGSNSYKRAPTAAEQREMSPWVKMPRKFLQTDAIRGADAFRDVFDQFIDTPTKFHGIEWDFMELEATKYVNAVILARFRPKPAIARMADDMLRRVSFGSHDTLSYKAVSPTQLRPCPQTCNGIDWERWILSIEGGCIVRVDTIFQALLAVMLLTYLPLHIKILDKGETYPKFPDSDWVYL